MFDRPDNLDFLHFHLLFLVLLLLLVVSTFRNKKRKVCSRTLWQFILGLLRAALLSGPRYIKTFSITRLDLICWVVKITSLETKNLPCLQNAVSLPHNTCSGRVLTLLKPVHNSGNSAYRLLQYTRTRNSPTQFYLTLRRLMSYIYIYIYIYIYGAPILDVSRSHTTTQHSR